MTRKYADAQTCVIFFEGVEHTKLKTFLLEALDKRERLEVVELLIATMRAVVDIVAEEIVGDAHDYVAFTRDEELAREQQALENDLLTADESASVLIQRSLNTIALLRGDAAQDAYGLLALNLFHNFTGWVTGEESEGEQ